MPYVEVPGGRIFYQDLGAGPPVIATHGFSETSDYWTVGGFASRVTPHLRLIAMDMRGHGRTQTDPVAPGFEVARMAADIGDLAKALGLAAYDLLGHATGSVVALRHAMDRPSALRRLVLTSAASATAMAAPEFFARMAAFYARRDWPEIFPRLRRRPEPFLHGLDRAPDRDQLWGRIEHVFAQCEPAQLSRFAESFYDDPDPRLEAMGRVSAQTLLITAELDAMMLEPSRQIAEHIPRAQLRHLPGVGHMTALECPDQLAELVLEHLRPDLRLSESARAS